MDRMTLEQAELLANLTASLRPDWGTPGIVKALEPLASTVDPMVLTLALLHAAADPTNQTPGILAHPGPHWDRAKATAPKPAMTGQTEKRPPSKAKEPYRPRDSDTSPMCETHPDVHAWACKPCRTIAPPPPDFRARIQAAAEAARKERQTPTE